MRRSKRTSEQMNAIETYLRCSNSYSCRISRLIEVIKVLRQTEREEPRVERTVSRKEFLEEWEKYEAFTWFIVSYSDESGQLQSTNVEVISSGHIRVNDGLCSRITKSKIHSYTISRKSESQERAEEEIYENLFGDEVKKLVQEYLAEQEAISEVAS